MSPTRDYTGTSQRGSLQEALAAALSAAARGVNEEFFTWRLKDITGSIGGIVGANDLSVTLTAGSMVVQRVPATAQSTKGDWYAWHNRMPGTTPTLHVVGTKMMPTPGYSIQLRPADPQGINPAVYILEEVITPPTGPVPQVETPTPVHYREATSKSYTDVLILPDNISVPVQEVS